MVVSCTIGSPNYVGVLRLECITDFNPFATCVFLTIHHQSSRVVHFKLDTKLGTSILGNELERPDDFPKKLLSQSHG